MKILIFGGTGFLGKNLVDFLLLKGYTVGLYVRPETANIEYLKDKNVKIHIGEFQYENDFSRILKDYDIVYHLISSTNPGIVNPLKDIETTIKPTIRLLEACVKNGIKKIIFFSSGGTVYGIPKKVPIDENSKDIPISCYGIQKVSLEKYFSFYNYCYDLPIIILRISNPYGKYQKAFTKQGLIANILGRYLTNNPVEIWGDGSIIRDYIYVDDVISAAEKALSYEGNHTIFNIGSGIGESITDIINLIDNISNDKMSIIRNEGRKIDVPINVLDIRRACKELKWSPKTSLRDGINSMIKYWNKESKSFDKNVYL